MLSRKDVLVLGMMVFSLFLGAGNMILPPMEGYSAGYHWLSAALGFVMTGILMPFVTLIVVTLNRRGEALSYDLPKWFSVLFWSLLYLIIGSTLAMPRVTNVAYEMGWQPLHLNLGDYDHIIFATVFNLVGMSFMLKRSSMVSTIGQFLAPLLLILLIIVGVGVFYQPLSEVMPSHGHYAQGAAFVTGMVSGYQTMDVLSAMAFGGIVAQIFASRQIKDSKAIFRYTLLAGSISVGLLAILYFCLFYLGATSHLVAETASNGGQIFARYIDALFGSIGVWMMSAIVILATLTTLVGVTSACADYFSQFHPRLNYPFFVILFTFATIIISEVGLTQILKITYPTLLFIYPVAIMLVVLRLIHAYLPHVKFSYALSIAVTLLTGAADVFKSIGLLPAEFSKFLSHFPFYEEGLIWLLPALCALGISILIGRLWRHCSEGSL